MDPNINKSVKSDSIADSAEDQQVNSTSKTAGTVSEETKTKAAFQTLHHEMQQIIQTKVEALEIKEDTPLPEIEKMIWQTIKATLDEHPELIDDSRDNAERARKEMLYAIPSIVYMKAAQIQEKDPVRKAFYLTVLSQFIKHFVEQVAQLKFEGTLSSQNEPQQNAIYREIKEDLRKICPEYIAFKKQAQAIMTSFLQNNSQEARTQYENLYTNFTKKFDFSSHYPLIKHVDYKERGDKSSHEASHIAGTASHFHTSHIMRQLASEVPMPEDLNSLEILSKKGANQTYEMLNSDAGQERYDYVNVRTDGQPGMKGLEIAERMRARLAAFANTSA